MILLAFCASCWLGEGEGSTVAISISMKSEPLHASPLMIKERDSSSQIATYSASKQALFEWFALFFGFIAIGRSSSSRSDQVGKGYSVLSIESHL